MIGKISCLVTIVCLLSPMSVNAAEFRGGQNVIISSDEVITDDLYVSGETVTVDGRIEGDLIASGREIRLNGEVTGDMMAAGQAVIVDGTVGDDVRIAGMALQLGPQAAVGDDVVSAGFSFESKPQSTTGGRLLYAGFQALLAGAIEEGLNGSATALEITGRIGGDSEVSVEGDPSMPSFVQYIPSPIPLPAVTGGLTIAETANIEGAFEYTSSREARGEGAASEALTYKEREQPTPAVQGQVTKKSSWPGRLSKLASLVVLGLLLAWALPKWLDGRSAEVAARPLAVAGVGFLGVAVLPVALLFLLALVIVAGIFLGMIKLGSLAGLVVALGLVDIALLVILFWITAAYLAPLIVGLVAGRFILSRVAAEHARGLVLPLLAGLVAIALLRYVPVLGFLVGLVVLFFGWGALLWWGWSRLRPSAAAS